MLSAAAITNVTPVQTPIVNTALPGTAATHVPYDNVAPSISSAAINNNASANNVIATADEPAVAQTETADAQTADATVQSISLQSAASGTQAAFVAQLISQDSSAPTQVILVQYEKLIALSNVKYKPSNAFKPEAPENIFTQLLQENKPAVAAQLNKNTALQTAVPAPPPSTTGSNAASAEQDAISLPAPLPTLPTAQIASQTVSYYSINAAASQAAQASNAYISTAARLNAQDAQNTNESA